MSSIGRWLRWLYPEFDDYGVTLTVEERRELARRFPPLAREKARQDRRPRTLILLAVGTVTALALGGLLQLIPAGPLTSIVLFFAVFVLWGIGMIIFKQYLNRGVEREAVEQLLTEMGRSPKTAEGGFSSPDPTDAP
ncbi:MAG: hypothetical protein ACOC0P_02285 [Planctomycetota bacterium]